MPAKGGQQQPADAGATAGPIASMMPMRFMIRAAAAPVN
jgi:hypothetical protein